MNILLLYPEKENNKKSIFNRLSSFLYQTEKENINLIEISIHLPLTWAEKLVDLNTDKLESEDIQWADYIIICAEQHQKVSTIEVIHRCKASNAHLVLCGKAIEASDEAYNLIDHFVPGPEDFEVFSNDIANNTLQKVYTPILSGANKVPFHAYSLWGLIGSFSKQIQAHSA